MNPEEPPKEQPEPHDEANILKPKRTRALTDKQRQEQAERMRAVAHERIRKSRLANEELLTIKEAKLKAKMDDIEKRKATLKGIKAEATPKPPPTPPAPVKEAVAEKPKKTAKRVVKQIIIDESSSEDDDDSEDGESETEQVVYVSKKSTKAKQSIVKPKPQKAKPKSQPVEPQPAFEPVRTIIKFF
jgi:hypothetical protein